MIEIPLAHAVARLAPLPNAGMVIVELETYPDVTTTADLVRTQLTAEQAMKMGCELMVMATAIYERRAGRVPHPTTPNLYVSPAQLVPDLSVIHTGGHINGLVP